MRIINNLLADRDWYPVLVKHKKTGETILVKSFKVNPKIHEVKKEYHAGSEYYVPFVGKAKFYNTNETTQVPVEGPQEVEESVEVNEEDPLEGLDEDMEVRFKQLQTRMKEVYGNYVKAPKEFREEYSRVKKILNK